ncbi:MAG: Ig-like domain-containing protein [Treponema sp.]|nr:Ig-like domain-containing protein [Treponema sp.]
MLLHKHGKKLAAALLGMSLICQSCSDNFFPEFKVEEACLQGGKALVVFSAPVNPTSAMNNFLFSEDERQVEGELSFFGNALLFSPKDEIAENHCYTITVYSGTQDNDGNTLQRDYKKTFFTKNDLSPPQTIQIKAEEDTDGNTLALKIRFNKQMNKESFLENFSIEPAADYFVVWSDDQMTATVKFKESLMERRLHSIKIAKNLRDSHNNTMLNDFLWSWTNKPESKNPSYKIYAKESGQSEIKEIFDLYENADFTSAMEILFDKKVLAESVEQGIEIWPPLSFNVEADLEENQNTCQRAKIIFKEKPKWNSEFYLSIKNDIKDKSGFSVPKRKILMKNNSPKDEPPKLECVALVVDGKTHCLCGKNNFKTIEFPVDKYPCVDYSELPIFFVFSTSAFAKGIDKVSAYEGISVTAFSAGSISANSLESFGEEEFARFQNVFEDASVKEILNQIASGHKKAGVIKYDGLFKNSEISAKPAAGLIEFVANEKICDDMKNFTEESVRLTCNKI